MCSTWVASALAGETKWLLQSTLTPEAAYPVLSGEIGIDGGRLPERARLPPARSHIGNHSLLTTSHLHARRSVVSIRLSRRPDAGRRAVAAAAQAVRKMLYKWSRRGAGWVSRHQRMNKV